MTHFNLLLPTYFYRFPTNIPPPHYFLLPSHLLPFSHPSYRTSTPPNPTFNTNNIYYDYPLINRPPDRTENRNNLTSP